MDSQEALLATVKGRKQAWFGYIAQYAGLPKTVLQGTLEGRCCHGFRGRAGWTLL